MKLFLGMAMQYKTMEDFGKRLAKIRKSRGLTQTELGKIVGVSYRVIAYYETESSQPPGPIIVDLAKALNVSIDKLFGIEPFKEELDPKTARLFKRLKKVTELPPADQRSVLKHIEALLERNRSSKKHMAKP